MHRYKNTVDGCAKANVIVCQRIEVSIFLNVYTNRDTSVPLNSKRSRSGIEKILSVLFYYGPEGSATQKYFLEISLIPCRFERVK